MSEAIGDSVDPASLVGVEVNLYGADGCFFCVGRGRKRVVYEVREDESDGYRSSMQDLVIADGTGKVFSSAPIAKAKLREAPAHVEGDSRVYDGWEFVDKGGHVWLRFGTENSDDYYPWFSFDWFPKAPAR